VTDKTISYRGKASEILRTVDAQVGDTLRIRKGEGVYEGILIPRIETYDENHVVLKLKSGYNVGIFITPDLKVEKIGQGSKPAFAAPALPKQKSGLPRVSLLSTGGTIASRVDYRTGGVRPALSANDLYSVVPELADVAQIDAEILLSLFSENIRPKEWTELTKAIAKEIGKGVDGVVVAHGTDTMGYTAAALSFALQNLPVPIVLVGSQRSADRPSSDAASNLVAAVTVAANAPFAEVVLAMHETVSDDFVAVHRGTKVRKCHTSRRDAFRSVNVTPLARVQERTVSMLTTDFRRRDSSGKLDLRLDFEEKVALIKFHPGLDSAVIDWYVKQGYRGIILEGTGLGHVSKYCFDSIGHAVSKEVVVGMTSQCVWGRIDMNVYDSGRDLLALGVVPLEDMLPETALVKLMWVLGQTHDGEEAKKLLLSNVAGEFSLRTLPGRIGEG
jgi:glutamyl-tRNA(Gln) amidotransferase subunit D